MKNIFKKFAEKEVSPQTSQTILDAGLGAFGGAIVGTVMLGAGIVTLPVTAGLLVCAAGGSAVAVGLSKLSQNTPK